MLNEILLPATPSEASDYLERERNMNKMTHGKVKVTDVIK